MLEKILKDHHVSAVLYSTAVILFTVFAIFYHVAKDGTLGIPVALFVLFMVLSVVATLFPAVTLRFYAVWKLRHLLPDHIGLINFLFIILEVIAFSVTVLVYMGLASGSIVAGLGIVLISAWNIVTIIFWGIMAAWMKVWESYSVF